MSSNEILVGHQLFTLWKNKTRKISVFILPRLNILEEEELELISEATGVGTLPRSMFISPATQYYSAFCPSIVTGQKKKILLPDIT